MLPLNQNKEVDLLPKNLKSRQRISIGNLINLYG
jgi:hypothetical protein